MDVENLKVTELKNALLARGLDTKGNKAALVERLQAAINESDDNNDKVNSDETIHNEDIEEESDQYTYLARTAAQLDTRRIRKHTSSRMFSSQFCDYKSKKKEHVETHKVKYCRKKG